MKKILLVFVLIINLHVELCAESYKQYLLNGMQYEEEKIIKNLRSIIRMQF